MARRALLGAAYKEPKGCGLAAYRATVAMDDIRADPDTAWIADSRSLNLWFVVPQRLVGDLNTYQMMRRIGHNTHAMTYFIAEEKLYNMVLTHPETDEPSSWDQSNALADMNATYQGWDSSLTKILDMVSKTQKWPIQQIEIPDQWSSNSGKLVLLGDAAHAMTPNMALGAAMAVEDAATLAECLKRLHSKDELRHAVDMYERLRIPRCKLVQEASLLHGYLLHYPDGPLQHARDAAMRLEVEGKHFIASPNQWSDPTTQLWCYTYDPVEDVRRNWASS
ncbi:hypothetical protein LTR99_011152 [Exophiala xenobiotica]|uniref:FAD-binding domain-containing protein n=1 Tax=Vermiconidia calcicola TaxID=1690605 RepID=A0AAV9PQY5_9PEZI|nr:hypothetical protein LTR92_010981 [Exophiala xenobiotica]KAK5527681.1 hypothetical protein LTR25_011004 [Vermiconidia calcicola]KAK5531559.1 hypothetical protein LTR23_009975 [Chaetothyriales sp. CCFEE 6169]KAK5290133.1 hypothetical protein LTR99_011152 [Exophiala xenobiotica]KAK5313035.1 hypothetical protein LTR93_011102 [Exophiala xenobiotica]